MLTKFVHLVVVTEKYWIHWMETDGRDGEVHTKTLGMNLILMRIDHYNLIFF
jgi:hypothetical protein